MNLVPKNARLVMGAALAPAYTCPAGTSAIVLMAQVANVDGSNPVDATVQWLDASNANAVTRLASAVTVPAKAAMGVIDGKLTLEANDSIQAMGSVANKLELTLSIMEMS